MLKLKVTEDGVVPLLVEREIHACARLTFHAVADGAVSDMFCGRIGKPLTPLKERVCGVMLTADTVKDQTAPVVTPEKPTESTRQK